MSEMVIIEEKVRPCSSKIPKPSLVAMLFCKIFEASGSSKWWKARLKSRNTFCFALNSLPFLANGFSRSRGAFAASTDVEM